MIVVDTSVWSLALRRRRNSGDAPAAARLLMSLIRDGQPVALPGVVMQELLSGLRHQAQFNRLRTLLEPYPLLLAEAAGHTLAAEISNACRQNGVQAGTVDALIVATTIRVNGTLLATDRDYADIAEHASFSLQLLAAD